MIQADLIQIFIAGVVFFGAMGLISWAIRKIFPGFRWPNEQEEEDSVTKKSSKTGSKEK